jgi:hypothetical protein
MPEPTSTESTRGITDGGATIRSLLAERGIDRYALVFTTGEGRFMPGGEEEVSGTVLTPDGRCFTFWTGWDDARGRARFRKWYEERPDPSWNDSAEYRRARAAVGLA